jgi:3-methyladenine DNA glycosylase Tag
MQPFAEIYAIACERHGGADSLEAELPKPLSPEEIRAIPGHRWLAGFSRMVFQTGMSWKVIDAKWPGFEEAFHGFDLGRNAMLSDDDLDILVKDTRIVRHMPKIRSVPANAAMLLAFAKEYGSVGGMFADWPKSDYIGLLNLLKSKGNRLGGNTAAYALRFQGLDGFVFSRDGVAALIRAGVIDKQPKSARDLAKVQTALNTWMTESGRGLAHISKILASSIDAPV